jgi:dienelactone hydrolase
LGISPLVELPDAGHIKRMKTLRSFLCLCLSGFTVSARAQETVLPATQPLTLQGDLSAQMVAGIDRFLMREIEQSTAERAKLWRRDFASREAYEASVAPNRERFRRLIGAVDRRLAPTGLEYVESTLEPSLVAELDTCFVRAVRWAVFEGVFAEGLLLHPKRRPVARVVALPDADQSPEMIAGLAPGVPPESQFARRLAEHGCQVLVPTLVDRKDTWSGNETIKRFTNLPHREWIYRQAFELGRHIIGYEVQKVLAAVDWFEAQESGSQGLKSTVGVAGYAEGGLIAFYAAALDPRIDVALVSGYFDNRDGVWAEPIYRNVFNLLREFGDAEIASLVAPRPLVIEHSEAPVVDGPPKVQAGRSGAASGRWRTPEFNTVDFEVNRARALVKPLTNHIRFLHGNEGATIGPCGDRALVEFLSRLGSPEKELKPPGPPRSDERGVQFSSAERQKRQVAQLVEHTQRLLRASERHRDETFWRAIKTSSSDEWAAIAKAHQSNLWDEVIGRFPGATLPANPRSRRIHDKERWTGYEVMLDVWPEVFAWGVLLLPKDLKPGERRPVVVCQHGLEGVPADTITDDPKAGGYGAYKAFSARLAERGFVVFAPHNPYRGVDRFRVLQRKANPLGKSLFAVILAQHDRILDWLSMLPFVDPKRIGFYGLSYGGKTAMRVPSLLDRYCLSICSADFNEWVTKCATIDSPYSYLYTIEYDMYEFDLGHTFNYAEMAALIAPRPFMVERGHYDGVAPDEWVAHEYARVRRFYAKLGIPERTEIEFFNGPHTINGVGTFKFLHQHLNWPEPK